MSKPKYDIPAKPTIDGMDEKFMDRWEKDQIYAFDESTSRDQVYSIDTPPPTVSGSLHVGSAFGFAHQDSIARYMRMSGKNVFFPMGWDDNGLPTERRVENFYGVRCDPSIPYDPNFTPPEKPDPKKKIPCSRPNFIELCEKLTGVDEIEFENVWRRLGLSVDWKYTYTTIGDEARKTSQKAFLQNLKRGQAYQSDAPTAWDVTFQTAVAQAEFEEREVDSAYHSLKFTILDSNETLIVDTTRPELLPACVALIAHPDDDRYKEHFGKTITTPLFKVPVILYPHKLADQEKGSGLVMCCTFGDTTDVIWWRELSLDVRRVMGANGRLVEEAPVGFDENAQKIYAQLAGKTSFSARAAIVELLKETGESIGDPRPIKHPVKFYEKGDKPLEIIPSTQWYIHNGGRDENLKDTMLEYGDELIWHPDYMKVRFRDWTQGLNGDWLISRQRYFGVPFPIWYEVDSDGNPDRTKMILPEESQLPLDPSVDVPNGFDESKRGQAGGFIGDLDVMDTWATSSLTPQIAGQWATNSELFNNVFPMDLRPQGPEIIRTWAFDTVLRSHFEHGGLPWKHIYINGWVLDPDRKKMSKSIGNVITPMDSLKEYGSDAFRYWACSAAPGTDTAFSVEQIKTGKRLVVKLLNASKFVLSLDHQSEADISDVTEYVDQLQLLVLADALKKATLAFEDLQFNKALNCVEEVFWSFCDDYLELFKQRAYMESDQQVTKSAHAAGRIALSLLQRGFAPHLPFVTDEVWSWWNDNSIHSCNWPKPQELEFPFAIENANEIQAGISEILSIVRKAKSEAQVSMKEPVSKVVVSDTAEMLESYRKCEEDLKRAGHISIIEYKESENRSIDVAL